MSVPLAVTLNVPINDIVEFSAICNMFQANCMLSIPHKNNSNIVYNPKNIVAINEMNFSENFVMTIRGNYTEEEIKMLDEWRVK